MLSTKITDNILNRLGQKIRAVRKIKNLSQEALADCSELDRTYIGGVERGERNISLVNIEKIAKALEVDIKDLFDNE